GKDLSHQPPKSDGLVVLNCTYPFPSGPHTLTMYFAVTPSLEVAVIVVTPTATAVTRPEGFTIATLGSSLFHARVFAASMGGAVAMIWRVFPANRLAPGSLRVIPLTTGALSCPYRADPPRRKVSISVFRSE